MSKVIQLNRTWQALKNSTGDVIISPMRGGNFELYIGSDSPTASMMGHVLMRTIILPKGVPGAIRGFDGTTVIGSVFAAGDVSPV